MRRFIVSLLLFLFSFQVTAEVIDDLRIAIYCDSVSQDHASTFCAGTDVEPPNKRSASLADVANSEHAPHADISDSVHSDATPLPYFLAGRAWQDPARVAFHPPYLPLIKPPPI
jgi:hypothetical protein